MRKVGSHRGQVEQKAGGRGLKHALVGVKFTGGSACSSQAAQSLKAAGMLLNQFG